MVENFLMGAGVKLANNVVTGWLDNSAEQQKTALMKDAAMVKAHTALVRETNKNAWASATRFVIFFMLTLAWCWMGVAGLTGMEVESTALVPKEPGIISKWFGGYTSMKALDIKGSTLLYQWFQIMEMMMGAFVMPGRRKV